jgi:hypothetical protein
MNKQYRLLSCKLNQTHRMGDLLVSKVFLIEEKENGEFWTGCPTA